MDKNKIKAFIGVKPGDPENLTKKNPKWDKRTSLIPNTGTVLGKGHFYHGFVL